jgi:hypothetical protein
MEDWDNFYMLAGGTAGTLIGLIFIVITLLWDALLPIASYVLVATAAAAWALEALFANMTGAVAVVMLLVMALRNSWVVTLAIAGRGR